MPTTKEKILDFVKPLTKTGKYVQINQAKISSLANRLKDISLPGWDNEFQFLGNEQNMVHYYFLLDSINFCFWAPKGQERWSINYNNQKLTGYYAFSYALKKALEADNKLFNPKYLSAISFDKFKQIFSGKGELLLMEERHKIIQENFKILSQKYGHAVNLVATSNHDVNKLVELLIENFPSFRDPFLKRAQIFCADLNLSLNNRGLGNFNNMQDLTVFSDYKLPQILQAEGVLNYSHELLQKIKSEELIAEGSQEELEIRAHTILACELLLAELNRLGRNLLSFELDWLLWTLAKGTKFALPHHRTLSIYY